MPSILDVNFDEVTDLKAVDDGEYKLRIINAKVGFGKDSGNPYFMVNFELPTESNTKDFNYLIMIPVEGMEQKKAEGKFRAFKNFSKAFGLDLPNLWGEVRALAESNQAGEIDWLVGAEGWALLATEEDQEYGPKNRIKRFM
jgi:hypothetical protein